MECPNCLQSYEGALSNGDQSAVPRILSKCGHSVCHSCVLKLYQNKRVQCPICGTPNVADSIQMFTKNLALMQLMVESKEGSQKSSSRQHKSPSVSGTQENDCFSSSSKSGSGASKLEISVYTNHQAYNMGNQICQEHLKTIEAFCWTDRQALCIECLLAPINHHKTHEVLNIEKSLEREDKSLRMVNERLGSCKTKIQEQQQNLSKNRTELDQQEDEYTQQLLKFFTEIKEIVEQRQKRAAFAIAKIFETKRKWVLNHEQKLKDLLNEANTTDFQVLSAQINIQLGPVENLMRQVTKEQQALEFIYKVDKATGKVEDEVQSQSSFLQSLQDNFDTKRELITLQKSLRDLQSDQQSVASQQPFQCRKGSALNQNHLQLATNTPSTANRQSQRDLSQLNSTISQKVKDMQKQTASTTKDSSQMRKSQSNFFTEKPQQSFASRIQQQIPFKGQEAQTKVRSSFKATGQDKAQRSTPHKGGNDERNQKSNQKSRVTQQNQVARANSRILYNNEPIQNQNQQIASIKFAPKFTGNSQEIVLPQREINLQQTMKYKTAKGALTQLQKNAHRVTDLKKTVHERDDGRISIGGGLMSNNISVLMREVMNRSVSESDNEEDESSSSHSITKLVTPHNEMQIFQTATAQPSSRDHLLKQKVISLHSNRHRDHKGHEQDLKQPFLNTTNLDSKLNSSHNFSTNTAGDGGRAASHRPSLRDMRNNLKQEKIMSQNQQKQHEQWMIKQAVNVEQIELQRQVSARIGDSRSSRAMELISSVGKETLMQGRQSISAIRLIHKHEIMSTLGNECDADMSKNMELEIHGGSIDESNILSAFGGGIMSTPKNLIQSLNDELTNILQGKNPDKGIHLRQRTVSNLGNTPTVKAKILDESQTTESLYHIGALGGVSESVKGIDSRIMQCEKGYESQELQLRVEVINPLSLQSQVFEIESQKLLKTLTKGDTILKAINDPRDDFSSLMIGGSTQNSQFNRVILQVNPSTKAVQESEIRDLPSHLEDVQFFSCCSGKSMTQKPLLVFAATQTQSKDDQIISIIAYDFDQSNWITLPDLPIENLTKPISEFQMLINESQLYILGGHSDGIVSKKVFRFDLSKQQAMTQQDQDQQEWEVLPEMSEGRVYFSSVGVSFLATQGVVVLGGYDGEKVLDTCEMFDTEKNKWVQMESLSKARMYCSSIQLPGSNLLFVSGGIDGSEEIFNSIEFYDPATQKWGIQQSVGIQRRFNHSLVRVQL